MRSIQLKSTAFFRRSTASMDGQGGLSSSYGCFRCGPISDRVLGVSRLHDDKRMKEMKQCNWCCAPRGEQRIRREANRVLTVHTAHNPAAAKVSRARALPRGACENLICAQSNDKLIDLVFEGLAERCRQKVASCLREFHHEGQPRGGTASSNIRSGRNLIWRHT